MNSAESVELLNFYDHDFMHNHLVEIQKQNTLEKAQDCGAKPKTRSMMIATVTDGHQGVQGHIFKQALGSKRQGIKRMLACYKKILNEKKRSLSNMLQCSTSSSHLYGCMHRHLYCCIMQTMIPIT